MNVVWKLESHPVPVGIPEVALLPTTGAHLSAPPGSILFLAAPGLRGCAQTSSTLWCKGSSLQWFLLQGMGSEALGLNSWGTWA